MFLFPRDSDIADYVEKYNKYEADYVRRIKAKYFSKNAMNGGEQPLLSWWYAVLRLDVRFMWESVQSVAHGLVK